MMIKMKTKSIDNCNGKRHNEKISPTTTIRRQSDGQTERRYNDNSTAATVNTRTTAARFNKCTTIFNSNVTSLFVLIMIVNVQLSCGLIEIATEREKPGK